MGTGVDPYAFTNAFNTQRQMGARMRAADQDEEMNALAINRARRIEGLGPNATPEQYVRAGDVATGNALAGIQRDQSEMLSQAFPRIGIIAADVSSIQDPAQKRAAFRFAIEKNAPLFDMLGMPSAQAIAKLDASDDATLDQTLQTLARHAPAPAPVKVNAGDSLVRQDGRGGYETAYTAPTAGGEGEGGFALSPGQVRFDAKGNRIASVAAAPDNSQTFSQERDLATKYDNETKNYGELLTSFETIKTFVQNGSPAGDIATVAAFMRAVDPGSRVTGAEQATAENAGGVPAVLRGYYNKLLGSGQLSEAQRADFLRQAQNLVVGRNRAYKLSREKYSGLAKRYHLNPANIIGDELTTSGAGQEQAPPAKTPSGATVSNW